MNAQEIRRINFAFEESKCAIADLIYKSTRKFISRPYELSFFDLLTGEGISEELVCEIVQSLSPVKKMVEPEMWAELLHNPQFLCLVTMAGGYPRFRPGAVLNWELFEPEVPEGSEPLAVSQFFYRSAFYESLNFLIMELAAPVEGLDGLTDMYFSLSGCSVEMMIFFRPVAPEKFKDYLQTVRGNEKVDPCQTREKALAALKYHLSDWKIFLLDRMAERVPEYRHCDSAQTTFAQLLCDQRFNGRYWKKLIADLVESCDGVSVQEDLYIADFCNISGIIQTILDGGIKGKENCPFINLQLDMIYPDESVKRVEALLETFRKNDGGKTIVINCVEPDFPLPELPFFAMDEDIIYCFRFVTPAELKKKKRRLEEVL